MSLPPEYEAAMRKLIDRTRAIREEAAKISGVPAVRGASEPTDAHEHAQTVLARAREMRARSEANLRARAAEQPPAAVIDWRPQVMALKIYIESKLPPESGFGLFARLASYVSSDRHVVERLAHVLTAFEPGKTCDEWKASAPCSGTLGGLRQIYRKLLSEFEPEDFNNLREHKEDFKALIEKYGFRSGTIMQEPLVVVLTQ